MSNFNIDDIVIAQIDDVKTPPLPIDEVIGGVFIVGGFPYFKHELTLVTPAEFKHLADKRGYKDQFTPWIEDHLVTGSSEPVIDLVKQEEILTCLSVNEIILTMMEQ